MCIRDRYNVTDIYYVILLLLFPLVQKFFPFILEISINKFCMSIKNRPILNTITFNNNNITILKCKHKYIFRILHTFVHVRMCTLSLSLSLVSRLHTHTQAHSQIFKSFHSFGCYVFDQRFFATKIIQFNLHVT